MRSYFLLLLAGVGMVVFQACTEPAKPVQAPPTPAPDTIVVKPIEIPIDSNLTHIAKLIAGLDTVLNYNHPNWNNQSIARFSRETEAKYNVMRENRLQKMAAWNQKNVAGAGISDSSFSFYPFSGGDFIHLHWLMPNASEYLMAAREAVGTIPALLQMSDTSMLNYLGGVDQVLRDIYNKSYFITKNMITDIHNANLVDGMLPILVWGAAKTNHEIISIEFFNVDTTGQAIAVTSGKYEGVTIALKDVEHNKQKKLTYLSADISNKGFEARPEIKAFLTTRVPSGCNSFVKSASYLMHYGSFTQIRDMVLDKSASLVEEDTGIPFKYFKQDIWNIQLFGDYEKPVSDFSENLF
ncbi:MAG: hypothetical protein ACKO7B_14875, partial [Flavobacteriales bacterium]